MKRKTIIKIVIGIIAFILLMNLLYFTEVEYSYPIWSKDGKRIYYVKNIDYYRFSKGAFFFEYKIYKNKSYVMSMNSDGSWKGVLAKFMGHTKKFPGQVSLSDLSVASNGRTLLFCLCSDKDEGGIYSVDVNGKQLKSLITYKRFHPYDIREFFISPDSKKIVYTRERYISGVESYYSVQLVNIDGSDAHIICEEDSHAKGWTADGKVIIEIFNDVKNERQLLVYDTKSQNVIKKISAGYYSDDFKASLKTLNIMEEKTYISPDGKKKIFWKGKNFGVIDMDGKNKKILLKNKVRYLK